MGASRPLLGTGAYAYDWLSQGGYDNAWGTTGADAAYAAWLEGNKNATWFSNLTPEWHRSDFQLAWDAYLKDYPASTAPTPPGPAPSYGDNVQWEYQTITGPTGAPMRQRRKPAGTITDPNDPNYGKPTLAGAWEDDKDYSDIWNKIQGMPGMMEARFLSNFAQWMEKNGYDLGTTGTQMTELQSLQDRLQGGNDSEIADMAMARDWASGGMGITAQEYSDIMERLTNSIASPDIGTQQGLSQQELADRARLQRSSNRIMTASFGKMLDNALASSGARAQSLMKADQYLTQMRDQELQYALAVSQEDAARRQQNFENQRNVWAGMFQAGQLSTEQFLNNLRQNRSLELQTVAAEISTIMNQNSQYLQMYGADLKAFELYAQNVFNSIQAEIGLDTAVLEQASEMYAQALAPWQAKMADWDKEMEAYDRERQTWVEDFLTPLEAQKDREAQFGAAILGGVFDLIGAGLEIIFGGLDIFGGGTSGGGTSGGNPSNPWPSPPPAPGTGTQMDERNPLWG